MQGTLLDEQQRLERAIGRVRWAAAGLALLLGPLFPTLSVAGTLALGIGVAAYNAVVLRASGRASTLEGHRRLSEYAFAADLGALSAAMLLFSVDPQWTTFFLGPLVIIMGSFRFGTGGAYTSAGVIGIAYVGISLFRARAFAIPLEPQRLAFHLAVFAMTAFLMDRVLRDDRQVRVEREQLIRRLQRRVEEDGAIAAALRVVASGPGRALVPAVLQASRDVFQFDRATVFVVDTDLGEYRVLHRLTPRGGAPPTPRMRLGEGLVGAAFAAGETLLVPNVLDDQRYVPRPDAEEARAVIVVPLSVGGSPLAALTLSRALPHGFGPDDARLAETVGGLIAQVLENERLFAEASEAKALRELDRLKDEFLTAVSHELRTPLTVISGSLELLGRQKDALGASAAKLIEQAERHVVRLQRNVEDLLDVAQLQEARIELQREFVDSASLLVELAAAHEPIAAAKQQRIVVASGDAPPVLVDRRRIQQALGNLVQNACRYAPDRTEIVLRAERAGDEVRFTVTDEGPGVPAAERQRIFDKFYRGERTKQHVSGTGLGLAIARTLVELHGGRIWLEDGSAKGAVFVIAVPHESVPAAAR
ncbi:MAG: ATP-binding protein [Candidatus Limnocylindria bacterium]